MDPTHVIRGTRASDLLRRVADAATPVWLVCEDWDRTRRRGNYWLFQGALGAVFDVLDRIHPLEYYVVSRKLEWLLLENHHGVVIGAGEWIVEILRALDAASSGGEGLSWTRARAGLRR